MHIITCHKHTCTHGQGHAHTQTDTDPHDHAHVYWSCLGKNMICDVILHDCNTVDI